MNVNEKKCTCEPNMIMGEILYWRHRFLDEYSFHNAINITPKTWNTFLTTNEGAFFGKTPEDLIKNLIDKE